VSNINKVKSEVGDFPVVCETCLGMFSSLSLAHIHVGDDPYVRMTKANAGASCKICERAFTMFRWKAGSKGRFKSTIVCQACAKMKNVCQCCLLDLEFGLPVQIRDKYLADHPDHSSMPMSRVGIDYQIQQQHALASDPGTLAIESPYGPTRLSDNPELRRIARTAPYYERNQARVCSFFLKGECSRGDECPFRHPSAEDIERMNTSKVNPENNISDRFFGNNDKVSSKIEKSISADLKSIPPPPSDPSVTTLFITNIPADPSVENHLRIQFEPFGTILKIKIVHAAKCAFVEFVDRTAAESAMTARFNHPAMTLGDKKMRLNWAKPQKKNESNTVVPYPSMDPRNLGNSPLIN
jgi:pre-mRNA-splicing factor RBM22/SLT11